MARTRLYRWSIWVAAASVAGCIVAGTDAHLASRTAPADRATIVHVLERVTFGASNEDVDAVERIGLESYLNGQLHPERIDDSRLEARLASFETLNLSTAELAERYFIPALEAQRARQAQAGQQGAPRKSTQTDGMRSETRGVQTASAVPAAAMQAQRIVLDELTQARMLRVVESERQLQEVLTDFWFNHFNVFAGKGQVRQYLTEYERDAIRPNVLGSFRTLLGTVAHSPAMLFYLDNWQSSAPNPRPAVSPELERRLDDPRLSPAARQRLRARLLEQQMRARPATSGRGLNENYARELMELHTLGVDGGYTQQDVVALARIFTGWTIDRPRQGGRFVFRPAIHDNGTKTLLGTTFQPSGVDEGERALDLLAAHPSTARHIAFKLAQRFVADEPPAALVDRVAAVFTKTKGDLREVTRAILASPEFLGAEYRRAKIKTPLEFVASALRATDATIASARPLVVALQNLGMPLYGSQPPTGYGATSEAWVNTGALVARMNFAIDIVSTGRTLPAQTERQAGLALDAPNRRAATGPIRIDVRTLAPDTSAASRARVIDRLLNGEASDATRETFARATTPAQLVALALGSPEFQRR